jgi:hypothetical protein
LQEPIENLFPSQHSVLNIHCSINGYKGLAKFKWNLCAPLLEGGDSMLLKQFCSESCYLDFLQVHKGLYQQGCLSHTSPRPEQYALLCNEGAGGLFPGIELNITIPPVIVSPTHYKLLGKVSLTVYSKLNQTLTSQIMRRSVANSLGMLMSQVVISGFSLNVMLFSFELSGQPTEHQCLLLLDKLQEEITSVNYSEALSNYINNDDIQISRIKLITLTVSEEPACDAVLNAFEKADCTQDNQCPASSLSETCCAVLFSAVSADCSQYNCLNTLEQVLDAKCAGKASQFVPSNRYLIVLSNFIFSFVSL